MTLVAAGALSVIPVFRDLGYEYAVVMAVVGSWIGILVAHSEARRSRVGDSTVSALPGFARGSLWALVVVLGPILALVGLYALFKPLCDPGKTLWLIALLPGVSVIHFSALGALLGAFGPRGRIGRAVAILLPLLAILGGAIRLVTTPGYAVFNAAFGFIPGPIYDELIRVGAPLITYRLTNLAWTAFLLSGAEFLRETVRLPKRRSDSQHTGIGISFLVALISGLSVLGVVTHRTELGLGTTWESLRAELSVEGRSPHFVVRCRPGGNAERRIKAILLDHEFSYHLVERELGQVAAGPFASFVYEDASHKKRLIGAGRTTVADPTHGVLHLNDEPPPHGKLTHELVHVVMGPRGTPVLGISWSIGLMEGLAVAVDGAFEPLRLHQRAAVLRQLDRLPDLEATSGAAGFWTSPGAAAYSAWGSFVSHLLTTRGASALIEHYADGDLGDAYGVSMSQLLDEWESRLNQIDVPPDVMARELEFLSRRSLAEKRCAHKTAQLLSEASQAYAERRFESARRAYRVALETDPASLPALKGLLRVEYAAGNLIGVEKAAEKLLESDPGEPGRVLAQLRLGDVAVRAGDHLVAAQHYGRALASAASAEYEAQVELRLAVLEDPGHGMELLEWAIEPSSADRGFATSGRGVAAAAHLSALQDSGLAQYILGLELIRQGLDSEAIQRLDRALELGLQRPALQAYGLFQGAVARWRRGRYGEATARFKALRDGFPDRSTDFDVDLWLERCRWYRENAESESKVLLVTERPTG